MKDYPLIKVTILYALGIILSRIINFDLNLTVIIISATFLFYLFSFFLHLSDVIKTVCISLLILSLGVISFSAAHHSIHAYPFKEGKIQNAEAFGLINKIELNKEYEIKMTVHIDSVRIKNHLIKLDHFFLCRIRDDFRNKLDSLYDKLRMGNYVQIKGVITRGRGQRNPGEFDYQYYLEHKGISGLITGYSANDLSVINFNSGFTPNLIFDARRSIEKRIPVLQNTQAAALLKGLIVGDRSEISDETKTDFINTGVVHVLAVSGLHVAYILLIFLFLFGRLNLYLRSILTILGLVVFIFITGSAPSVVRSGIMGIILILAFISNRSTNVYNSLALSALIILIINPMDLLEPGFQLSYSAVLSIVALTPFFQRRIKGLNISKSYLKNILLFCTVTLAAQLGTLPFTLIYFKKLSLISLFANIFIIPLIGAIISIGILSLFLSIIWLNAAVIFSIVNNLLVRLLFYVTHQLSSFKYSFTAIHQFTLPDAVIFYFLIFIFFYFYEKMNSGRAKIILTALVLVNIIMLSSLDDKVYLPENRLSIAAIDIGQGDSFLIKFPNGKTALIDAGEATQYFDNGERVILPLLQRFGIGQIDYGFISHVDSDHYAGFISLIKNGIVKQIYKPLPDSLYRKDVRLEKFLKEKRVPVHYYKKSIVEIGNARMYILNNINDPEYSRLEMNDKSGIIKLVYGNKSFLFVGDAEKRAEKNLINCYSRFLRSDLLKLGHHGSSSGSSIEFLNNVNPGIALISAGQYNKFKHPSKIVLQRLEERKIKSYRTDELGCVIFNCDGQNLDYIDWKNL